MTNIQYTPWMAQAGQNVGTAIQSSRAKALEVQKNKLAGSAYMGDPVAMQELMQLDPALGVQLQQAKQKQQDISAQKELDRAARGRTEEKEMQVQVTRILEQAAQLPMGQAKSLVEGELGRLAEIYPKLKETMAGGDGIYDEADHAEVVKLHGGGGRAFEGKGMPAQVSSALVKGAEDPAYRNTAEYARAYDIATEPKVVRTPTGDVLQYPKLDPRFKPPGAAATKEPVPVGQITSEEISFDSAPGTPKQNAIIPGTGKISTDQKAYNKDYSLLKKSYDSMQNYIDTLSDLGPQMALGPLNAEDTQKLESAYARAMLDAKETNNLGVLNGPDVGIIRKLMGDPTGVSGQIRGKGALLEGGKEAMKQIEDNFKSLNGMMVDTPVKTRELSSKKEAEPVLNESDLSVTIGGKKSIFPSIEKYNAYREAAGL